jgi:hypothetical protein
MKYIDGIKTPFPLDRIKKHIKIIYYKPLIICDDHLSICKGELKWVDGQPYEIIVLGED